MFLAHHLAWNFSEKYVKEDKHNYVRISLLEWGDTFLGAVDKNIKRRVLQPYQLFTCSIPTKFQNFDQISQCLQSFTILPNFIISQAVRSMKPKLSLQNHWKVILCQACKFDLFSLQASVLQCLLLPWSPSTWSGMRRAKSSAVRFPTLSIFKFNTLLLEIPCSTHC